MNLAISRQYQNISKTELFKIYLRETNFFLQRGIKFPNGENLKQINNSNCYIMDPLKSLHEKKLALNKFEKYIENLDNSKNKHYNNFFHKKQEQIEKNKSSKSSFISPINNNLPLTKICNHFSKYPIVQEFRNSLYNINFSHNNSESISRELEK